MVILPETFAFLEHSYVIVMGQTMNTLLDQNSYFHFSSREDLISDE